MIGILCTLTRFVALGKSTASGTPVFDEKHYVPQAWDMVLSWQNPVVGGIESNPGYGLVVHPPLGKQLLALGEWVFGYSLWGWRVMTALTGTLVVLTLMALVRQISQSWLAACFAGVLGTFDGLLLVTSRFGMLDIFEVLFVVAAAWALARDAHQMRVRMDSAARTGLLVSTAAGACGPRLGFRWWRFTAGVFLGLAVSVKWSGLYYIAFFGVLSVALDAYMRHQYRIRRPVLGALLRDAFPAFASIVVLPAALYLWSWRAWFSSETSVYRWAKESGLIADDSFLQKLPEALAGWLYYHQSVLKFHESLTSSSGHSHPWDSKPWSWLAATRPILYLSSQDVSCSSGTCKRMLYLFGTPAIWWLTIPALVWAAWWLLARRDGRYLLPLVGFAAGFLPWLASYDRQMYFFYAAPLVPFTICLLSLALLQLTRTGPRVRGRYFTAILGARHRLTRGGFAVICYLALVVAMFVYFAPILYGILIPDSYYEQLMWLPSWR